MVKDVDQSEAYVTLPDGTEEVVAMKDDGMHGDGAAGDGIYGGYVPAKMVVLSGNEKYDTNRLGNM